MANEQAPKAQKVTMSRPLRNFEVDKYWLTVAKLAISDSWSAVFEEFSWRRLVVPALVAIIASVLQFYFLGWASTEENLKILGTSVVAGLLVFIVLAIGHLVRKPCELYVNANEEIARLYAENDRLTRPPENVLKMAEEDPRVYIRPLNQRFLSQGFMSFEISNIGQRINPAEGITVHRIPCVPEVRFQYIDLLLANEHKTIAPTVGDFLAHNNIIAELDKAWRQSWESEELINDVMREEAEFPFEITITYHDHNSSPRTFESTTMFRYCPTEYEQALEGRGNGEILKVVPSPKPRFRRLS